MTRRAPFVWLLGSIGLVLLIGSAWADLDASELSPAEAESVRPVVGALDSDLRGVSSEGPERVFTRVLAAFAQVVGTSENGLRLAVVLGLVLAAWVAGELGATLGRPMCRPCVWLVFVGTPFLVRSDVLYAGLLPVLPAALLLGALAFRVAGHRGWLVASALGASALPFFGVAAMMFGGGVALVAALLPLRNEARERGGRAAILLGVFVPMASVFYLGVIGRYSSPFESGASNPHPAWNTLWEGSQPSIAPLLILGLTALLLGEAFRQRGVWGHATIIALVGALGLFVQASHGDPMAWALIVPPVALGVAGTISALPKGPRVIAAAALLALACWIAGPRIVQRSGLLGLRAERQTPMQDVLDRARRLLGAGGRLVVEGPLKSGLLYYTRRGHHPGVPLVLIPEDTAATGLAPFLKDRMGLLERPSPHHPTILIHPRPEVAPSGSTFVEGPGLDSQLARLQLTSP